MIRNARMEDVRAIYNLLHHFSNKGLLLARSFSSLYDQLRDFHVFVEQQGSVDRIVGAGAMHICWEDLAEIRSLAVDENFQRKGIGSQLVAACLADAETFGIHRVFTLTYQPGFFASLGFKSIDKKELPHKVWSDCINCPKFPDCNEEAMIWQKQG
ncbi:MAG: N-acetyltransferase [Desulfobacterales bacterium]|nr:MAG: N-acetyltransferase [Desulfobacterales bacterium]